jgi:urease accessory protein
MRGVGEAQFSVAQLRNSSIVTRLYHQSPLRLFAPRAPAQMPWLVATSLGGGLVDGDRLRVEGDLGANAALYLGTQSVTKVYRGAAEQHAELSLGAGSFLAMVSDPVMCFAGARYRQTLRFAMTGDASLLLVDGLLAGRVHHGEVWQFDAYESHVTITRDGTPLVEDVLRLRASDGSLAARGGRFTALATIWAIGPRLATTADAWRTLARTNHKGGDVWIAHGEPRPGVHVLRLAATTHRLLIEAQQRLLDLAALLGEDPHRRRY